MVTISLNRDKDLLWKLRKILNPALYIMSMLSFKAKIIFNIYTTYNTILPFTKNIYNRYNRTDVYTQQLIV